MRVKLAYLGVVLVWTTTPLAIKWSGEGLSFILGLTARMSLGWLCLLLCLLILRKGLSFKRAACLTYTAVCVQLYFSMLATYWAAQYIPSGWMSVIFGLNPFMTALLAAVFLKERSLGWQKISAYIIGVCGLALMFLSALDLNQQAWLGVVGILISTFLHAVSAVWVKRINARLPAIQQITGGLLFALPLYYLTWYLVTGAELPTQIPDKALYAILYLGLIATTFGFIWYYYILLHLPATKVALLNLMTPVLSLWLGFAMNHETLSLKTAIGTGLIMLALLWYQIADRRQGKSIN